MAAKSGNLTKLHLGSGNNTPSSWINIDGSWNAKLAKHPYIKNLFVKLHLLPPEMLDIPWSKEILIHDLTKPLPFPSNSVDVIYSAHTLEHLYHSDAAQLLGECFRVLKSDGIIRIIVPDLEAIISEYMGLINIGSSQKKNNRHHKANKLLHKMIMTTPNPPAGNFLIKFYNYYKNYNTHKWMYDQESLHDLLASLGFDKVSRKNYLKSKIANITEVERENRVTLHRGLCMEATKP
jgi:predicted SAM-dependent methyltransferase